MLCSLNFIHLLYVVLHFIDNLLKIETFVYFIFGIWKREIFAKCVIISTRPGAEKNISE